MENYFNSQSVEILRSEIHPSNYNPRKISKEGKKNLKNSIKKYGVVGGIVVNKGTGNALVGGHQKVEILDELNGYPGKDYTLRVEMVDIDEKQEKQLNIILNNPKVGGQWDWDALREIIPQIDYKDVGFDAADLTFIGIDEIFRTSGEEDLADAFADLTKEEDEQKASAKEQRKAEQEAQRGFIKEQQETAQAMIDHMKDVKQDVKEKAKRDAENLEAYIMVSFDTYQAKADFCQRIGLPPVTKFVKGEDLEQRVEVIYDEEEYE